MKRPQSILITGASSGIGGALTRAYAASGTRLGITGRNRARLGSVADGCRLLGAAVRDEVLDVRDAAAMADWVARMDAVAPLDLVIANAGISAGRGHGVESAEQTREIFATNLDGVLNLVLPAVERMRPRGQGQIAILASLAGFRGFPGAPAYSASKAAVKAWGEALRGALRADGIAVSVVCPGFAKSRITAGNAFRMPMLMEADQAARRIQRGLARNRARIAFPLPLYLCSWFIGSLPPALSDPMVRRLPDKS